MPAPQLRAAFRVGPGRYAPGVQPETPAGHQCENIGAASDVSPKSVQFSVAKSVQFSVAIDTVPSRPARRSPRAPPSRPEAAGTPALNSRFFGIAACRALNRDFETSTWGWSIAACAGTAPGAEPSRLPLRVVRACPKVGTDRRLRSGPRSARPVLPTARGASQSR